MPSCSTTALDADTCLPVLLEGYALAFAKRSHQGPASLKPLQHALLP